MRISFLFFIRISYREQHSLSGTHIVPWRSILYYMVLEVHSTAIRFQYLFSHYIPKQGDFGKKEREINREIEYHKHVHIILRGSNNNFQCFFLE